MAFEKISEVPQWNKTFVFTSLWHKSFTPKKILGQILREFTLSHNMYETVPLRRDHSFNMCTKFSKKLTFPSPWYAHVRVRIRG